MSIVWRAACSQCNCTAIVSEHVGIPGESCDRCWLEILAGKRKVKMRTEMDFWLFGKLVLGTGVVLFMSYAVGALLAAVVLAIQWLAEHPAPRPPMPDPAWTFGFLGFLGWWFMDELLGLPAQPPVEDLTP